jgi:hypothetical protein
VVRVVVAAHLPTGDDVVTGQLVHDHPTAGAAAGNAAVGEHIGHPALVVIRAVLTMDDQIAAKLAGWAEHEMALTPNSSTALHGAAAAEFGRATIADAVVGGPTIGEPHVPAEPDPGIAAILERTPRAITGTDWDDGGEVTPGESPCPGADETG